MLEIRKIEGRKALTTFVQFAIDLYKGFEYYVPPIISMEVDTFDPQKNPVYKFCDSVFYMAYRDNKPVGRIAGFINHRNNEQFNVRICRFCWIDFVDDAEVSRLLLDTVKAWGKERGMDSLMGPMGPSDIDNEGCLVEGFDQLPTIVNSYNAPYYQHHFEAYGMKPDATWYEYRMTIPDHVPERYLKIANMVKERYGLRVFTDLNAKRVRKEWGKKIFTLMNDAYSDIYGFTSMTDEQIEYYVEAYLPIMPLKYIRLITDRSGDLVAFGLTIPSLSRAQQKAKGKLFPFGWFHILKALYWKGGTDTIDMMLIGVRSDYKGKGLNAAMMVDGVEVFHRNGFKYIETNAELVTNTRVQGMWEPLNPVHHKTRIAYKISIQ